MLKNIQSPSISVIFPAITIVTSSTSPSSQRFKSQYFLHENKFVGSCHCPYHVKASARDRQNDGSDGFQWFREPQMLARINISQLTMSSTHEVICGPRFPSEKLSFDDLWWPRRDLDFSACTQRWGKSHDGTKKHFECAPRKAEISGTASKVVICAPRRYLFSREKYLDSAIRRNRSCVKLLVAVKTTKYQPNIGTNSNYGADIQGMSKSARHIQFLCTFNRPRVESLEKH